MSEFSKSIEQIRLIAHVLGDLNKDALYVGGATIPFYIPKGYLQRELEKFRKDVSFIDAVPGAVFNHQFPEEGLKSVLKNIEAISKSCKNG